MHNWFTLGYLPENEDDMIYENHITLAEDRGRIWALKGRDTNTDYLDGRLSGLVYSPELDRISEETYQKLKGDE